MLKALLFIEILVAIGSALFFMSMTRAARREIGHLPGLVFALLAAIVFLSPQLLVAHAAIFFVPLLIARNKLQVGIVVALGMIAVPSLPTGLALSGIPIFNWSIQSTIAVGGLVALLATRGKLASAPPWTDSALIIVVMMMVVVAARGTAWTNWLRSLAEYSFAFALPVFIITRSITNAIERRLLLTAIAGAGIILAIIVLYEARGNWPLYAPLVTHYNFDVNGIIVKWRGGLIRAYGPMSEATNMAFVLVICFAAALAARRSFKSNMLYVGIVALIALGTLAPQSRGGLIGIAVAFVISAVYRRGLGSLIHVSLASMILAAGYFGATAVGSIDGQIKTSLQDGQGSSDYRTQLLTRGLQEFWKNPLWGDSYTNVVARMRDMVQGEGIVDFVNTYLYFALFTGAFGLVLFCLAFLLPMGRLVVIRNQLPSGSDEREIAGFSLALLTSAAVDLAFASYAPRPAIFWLVASAMAFMTVVPRRARSVRMSLATVSTSTNPQAA